MVFGEEQSEKYVVDVGLWFSKTQGLAVLAGTTTPGSPDMYDFDLKLAIGNKIVATRVSQPTVRIPFDSEVQAWPSMKNSAGLEMSYPPDWSAASGAMAMIAGPGQCNSESKACGRILIGSNAVQSNDISPQAFCSSKVEVSTT
jgi:hypothetical protein